MASTGNPSMWLPANGTTFGSGGHQLNYSEEGERLFLFLNLSLSFRGRARPSVVPVPSSGRPVPSAPAGAARAAPHRSHLLPPILDVSFCANFPMPALAHASPLLLPLLALLPPLLSGPEPPATTAQMVDHVSPGAPRNMSVPKQQLLS